MDSKKPEDVDVKAMFDDETESPISHSSLCSGYLGFENPMLVAAMSWHLDHCTDREARREFFRYRCHALADALSHLKGVIGLRMDDHGNWTSGAIPGRPTVKKCSVSMGYRWPRFDIAEWENVKQRFVDVFAPAAIYGAIDCKEEKHQIHVRGVFRLPDKGQSDA